MFNFIALLGALVLCFGGWTARGYLESHPGVHLVVPAPLRWVLPAAWKRVDVVTLADQRDRALAEAAGAKQCAADRLALQAAVTAQNVAVDALHAQSEAWLAQSAQAAQAARKSALALRAQAQEILTAQPQGSDLCAAADLLIVQEAGQ